MELVLLDILVKGTVFLLLAYIIKGSPSRDVLAGGRRYIFVVLLLGYGMGDRARQGRYGSGR